MKTHVKILIMLLTVFFACNTGKDNDKQAEYNSYTNILNHSIPVDSVCKADLENSSFELIIYCLGDFQKIYPVYARNKKNGHEIRLFDIFYLNASGNPEHLIKEYYSFPFENGGNSIYAQGYYLVKATEDTAFLIAPYSGYEDIDGDGDKEFYVYNRVEKGESHATDKYEKYEIKLINDTLNTDRWF